MKCKYCDYEWTPRVKEPKACPKCKTRFDYVFRKEQEKEE